MRRLPVLMACVCGALVGGCGAQDMLLGTQGSYLFTVADALALPNETVELRARLQGGQFLRASEGHVVRFYRDGKLFKAAETDENGVAAVSFTPTRPGDYWFGAQVADAGLSDRAPAPQKLLIACRAAESPMAVVDMDKTVVASGFHMVLIGDPTPMAGSSKVLRRLAATRTIVYLTHRPDYFGPKSKQWLRDKKYPPGPVLLSTVSGFLKGSGKYKSEMLRRLQGRFKKIEVGIGDKVSDAAAYHENGLKSFLIIQVPEGEDPKPFEKLADEIAKLPAAVQVVTDWDEIEKALFSGASFPRAAAHRRLRKQADARRKKKAGAAAKK